MLISQAGLPQEIEGASPGKVMAAMKFDKKFAKTDDPAWARCSPVVMDRAGGQGAAHAES